MKKTTNCNLRTKRGTVYCGRDGSGSVPSDPKVRGGFGNPVKIGCLCQFCRSLHIDGGSTLKCYREYLISRLTTDGKFREEFYRLRGEVLECFCKPSPCHTDVMIEFLDKDQL